MSNALRLLARYLLCCLTIFPWTLLFALGRREIDGDLTWADYVLVAIPIYLTLTITWEWHARRWPTRREADHG